MSEGLEVVLKICVFSTSAVVRGFHASRNRISIAAPQAVEGINGSQ